MLWRLPMTSRSGFGAWASIDAAYGLYAVGIAVTPELEDAINARVDALADALSPWRAPHGYVNFDDRPGESDRLFLPEAYRRLRDVKTAYDPGDLFLSNHPILPAAKTRGLEVTSRPAAALAHVPHWSAVQEARTVSPGGVHAHLERGLRCRRR